MLGHSGMRTKRSDVVGAVGMSAVANYLSPFRIGTVVTKPIILSTLSKISKKKVLLVTALEQFFDISWQVFSIPLFIFIHGWAGFNLDIAYKIGLVLLSIWVSIIIFGKRMKTAIPKLFCLIPKSRRKFLSRKLGIKASDLDKLAGIATNWASNPRALAVVTLQTLAIVMIYPFLLLFCAKAVGVSIGYKTALTAYWLSYTVGRISGIPSGLGTKDLTLAGLLTMTGVGSVELVSILVLHRITSLLPLIAFGLTLSTFYGARGVAGMTGKINSSAKSKR